MSTKKENETPVFSGQNDITRRDALKTAAAVGTTAALASSLPINSVLAATPKKGGHFKLAVHSASTSDSLDTTTYVSQFLFIAGYLWGNGLIRFDKDFVLEAELAESWDVSKDAKTWVFKIRKGVEFHNGKSLTADDVVWSINRHRAPDAASGLGGFLGQIVEFKATGSHEITFVLEAPNADWPYILTDYHLQMQPAGGPGDKGLGTGPYVYEDFDPGVRFLLKRNPNYWKSGFAHFDSIEQLAINDPTARVSALQTGDVDFITDVAPKVANLLERQFTIHRVESTWFNEFIVHTDTPPFDDNNMRLALKHAINREEMVEKVMSGAGVLGNDHPVPSFFRYHAADLPQRAYDPDKAKFYYKKTGHSGSLPPVAVANITFPNAVETAELFQAQAAKVGINFDVERAPDDGYWSNIWNQRPFFASVWAGRATEDIILSQGYHSEAVFNETHWKRADVDKMLLDARKELNEAKRGQIYRDIQELISNEGGAIIPAFQQLLFGSSKKVAGFYTSPFGDGNFIEHMYFES